MADIVTKNEAFFAELLSPSAAKWSAGVAFDRSNGLPLDQWSVFQSEAKATEYLSNAKAYPGQVIAYAEANGEMKVCVLSQNAEGTALVLKPVGIIPAGDGKTVEVSATGEISLKGAATATAGQQPRIVNKGTAEAPKLELEWYTPDNSTVAGLQDTVGALKEAVDGIVEEDGTVTKEGLTHRVNGLEAKVGEAASEGVEASGLYKEIADALAEAKDYADQKEHKNTTYSLSQDGMVVTLTPSEGEAQSVTIDAYNKKEVDDKFAALPEDKDTTYTAKADDKVLKLTGTEFSTELGLKHENGKISLTGIGGAVIAEFSDAEFVADGVLEDVSYNAETKELTFTWNVKNADGTNKTDVVDISDLIDTYTAGNGLQMSGSEFSVKVDSESEEFLSVGTNGVKLAGVQEAIDSALETAKKYADDNDVNTTYTAGEGLELNGTEFKVKVNSSADEKLYLVAGPGGLIVDSDVLTGTIEGAIGDHYTATVEPKLNEKADKSSVYTKEEADAAFTDSAEVDSQIDAKITALNLGTTYEPIGAEGRAKDYVDSAVRPINEKLATIEEGAQVNKLESVVVAEGAKLSVSTIVDKTITIDDAALRQAITEADTKAQNAGTVASNAAANAQANALLIQENTNQINALLEVDEDYSERIAKLEADDATHKGEYTALSERVTKNEGDIVDLQSGKAAQADLLALQNRVGSNETAIKSINETSIPAIQASIDDLSKNKASASTVSSLSLRVSKVESDLTSLYSPAIEEGDDKRPAAGIIANEIEYLWSAISNGNAASLKAVENEQARAEKIEQGLQESIDGINALLNTVDSEDSITSLKELAIWVEEHGGEASEMAKAIEENTKAIKAIFTPRDGETEPSGYLAEIAIELSEDIYHAKQDAIRYTDAEIAKIHTVDDKTIKLNENKAYVAEVSTDVLVQGAVELVFSAGNASGYNTSV